jgi:FKBP-type peptidyl-prolyl cis-trans isomerase SlyD
MKIAKNSVVSVHYTLSAPDGTRLDASPPDQPLVYLHGAGNMIPGFEQALDGKAGGDKFQVEIQPDQGYGPHDARLVRTVPRDAFKGVDEIEPGAVFQAQAQDGSVHTITVVEVAGDEVKVDGNHPLAGMVLSFDIDVVDVRAATEEELSHGHVHGSPGGGCC